MVPTPPIAAHISRISCHPLKLRAMHHLRSGFAMLKYPHRTLHKMNGLGFDTIVIVKYVM
jgi:hypothetical protein